MADVEAGRSMMNQRVVLTKSDIPGAKIPRETVKECSIFQVFSDKHPQPLIKTVDSQSLLKSGRFTLSVDLVLVEPNPANANQVLK